MEETSISILCSHALTACHLALLALQKTTLELEHKDSQLVESVQKTLMFLTSKVRKIKRQRFDNRPFLGASPKLHGSRVVNKPEFSN